MKRRTLFATAVAAVVLTATQAGEAQQRTRALSQGDVAQAQQQHPQLVTEFGGELTGARGDYVREVGARVTAHSNVSGGASAFRITTLNSPVMNAFAVPGGYLYITRQLLALMNDEAELASVLGHEAGHVDARHSQERQRANILSQLAAVLVGVVTRSGDLARILGQGAQVWALSYSRRQEYEADDFGIRYMAAAGYDPNASPSLLSSLGTWSDLETRFQGREDDQRAVPSWARTHPLSADRVRRATQKANATGRAGQGNRNRARHLGLLDGMFFDDDPEQGIVEGNQFLHPDLRLAFTAPRGFGMQNGTRAVSIIGNSGQALFSTGRYDGDLGRYIAQVFQALGGNQARIAYSQPRGTTINGIPAAYSSARANTQQGTVDINVFAYEFANDRAYHFVTVTRAGTGLGPFTPMIQSLRRLTAQEAAQIRPRVLDIVTVGAGDTIQSLAGRMAYSSYQLERFRALNGLAANSALQRGQQVKLVVYGRR